jgi:hypothetical protein
MKKSSFLIVADRGNLKAFRLGDSSPERRTRLELVQAFSIVAAHQKLSEMLTDQAGRFPVGSGGNSQGRHQNAISESNIDLETDRRIQKELAGHIDDILKREQPATWAFAAPSEINRAVLDKVAPAFVAKLVENVPADLVNMQVNELAGHFESVR